MILKAGELAADALRGMPGRALDAAVAVATELGIDASRARVIRFSYSAYVHLAPESIVARVGVLTPLIRAPLGPWLKREVLVARALADRGLPVIQPVDDDVHHQDGLAMTFWQYMHFADPVPVPTPGQVGRSLFELHEAMRSLDLPSVTNAIPAIDDIRSSVTAGLLEPAAGQRLTDVLAAIPAGRPAQILHGDAHANNIMYADDRWMWHDFEETCFGTVEWDLATLLCDSDFDGRAALQHYSGAPAPGDLEPWVRLRQLHVPVWIRLHEELSRYQVTQQPS